MNEGQLFDYPQMLIRSSEPAISFNRVFSAVPFHRTSIEAQKKRENNF